MDHGLASGMSEIQRSTGRFWALVVLMLALGFSMFGCIPGLNFTKEIQGVTVTEEGSVAVTFRVPDGLSVDDVLGKELSEETHTVAVSNLGNPTVGVSMLDWAYVDGGGIVSWIGGIYRYSPTARESSSPGVSGPPSYVMLYSVPEESEIFNPEDAALLEETHGIKLFFEGGGLVQNGLDAESSEGARPVSHISDYEVVDVVNGFNEGISCVWVRGGKPGSSLDVTAYLVDVEGNAVESPASVVSNFYNGKALASVGINADGYADSIIDENGNIVWSIKGQGLKAASEFFDEADLVEVRSFFTLGEYPMEYRGYFPVVFSLESYEFSGNSVGVLDADGNWVVEPNDDVPVTVWRDDSPYYLATNTFLLDYSSGEVEFFDDCDTNNDEYMRREALANKLDEKGELAAHEGLAYLQPDEDRDTHGFHDENGELVIDLADEAIFNTPVFVDGYALLDIENDQGSDYYVVIDDSGKWMFEPKKNNGHGDLMGGAFVDESLGVLFSVTGEPLAEDVVDFTGFSGGRAWVETADGWHCIDESGQVVF